MELLFALLIAFGLGLGAHYLVPGRETNGAMLVPSIGAAAAAIVWVVLVWAGWTFDGGWIWVVSLAVAAIASTLAAVLLPPRRRAEDAALFERLSHARA